MRITLFVFLACLSACAATSGSVPQTEPRPDLPVERKAIAAKDPLINGVWRSRGYGWILQVEDGAIRQYEAGGFGCYARPEGAEGQTAMLSLPFSQYRLSTNGETAMFMYGPDTTGPIFERLPALPDACAQPAKASVETSFEIFLSMFDEHYAHFGDRGADWPKLAQEAQAIFNANPTEKGFIEAADHLLKALQDSHTRLIAFTQEGRQRIQYGLGETLPRIRKDNGETAWLIGLIEQLTGEILDPGARHVGEDRILWGTVSPDWKLTTPTGPRASFVFWTRNSMKLSQRLRTQKRSSSICQIIAAATMKSRAVLQRVFPMLRFTPITSPPMETAWNRSPK